MNGNDKQSATETIAAQEAVNYAKLYGMACEAIDFAGFTITTDADKGIMNLRHKNASPVAFVGSDGRPAWIHDGIGIGKTTAIQVGTYLYATPVAAAPVGFDCTHSTEDNYQHFLAYSGLEGSDVLRYAYFHGADVGIDRPRMQATPAAPGIDLRNAILQLREDAFHMKDPGDTVNAYDRVLRLIYASPKGGSTDPIIPTPHQECYSDNDGDSWYDHPADSCLVDGLAVGDTYTLSVSHYSVGRTYRVTKAPDGTSDDYEVEPVQALVAEVGA